MNPENTIVQGVLSYDERLQRAQEELQIEHGKHEGILNSLEIWRTRGKELEARLQIYEGRKLHDHHKFGSTNDAYDDIHRHVNPQRTE